MNQGTRTQAARVGIDIGGTFTDVALECRGRLFSAKALTDYAAPERAILDVLEDFAMSSKCGPKAASNNTT
jgi:N-methylhydantoinase A